MSRFVAGLCCALPLASGVELNATVAVSSNSGSEVGCSCPGMAPFSYERLPRNDAGGGCVGGCGGGAFSFHKDGGIVRKISVWWNPHVDKNSGIKAIRISYFDDPNVHVAGNPTYKGAQYKEINFNPGETIKGDVALSGNGFGTRLGYIHFETSGGQKFEAGQNSHTKYLFDSGGSFISGIGGGAGEDVDVLYFYFWKPIRSLYFLNINYPTLASLTKVKSPAVIAEKTYCNDNSEPRPTAGESEETTVTIGHDSCFTATFTETFGGSIQVKSGIPVLGEVKAESHWEISASQEFKNCNQKSTSTRKTVNFPSPTLAPHLRTSYQFTQWQGELSNLPFTATLEINFFDGSKIHRTQTGTYKGTSFSSVQQSWTREQTGVTDCNRFTNSTVIV